MTCIAAVVHEGECWIGGDAAGSSGWTVMRSGPKVFRLGPMVVGFSGSFRFGQLLRFKLTPPDHPTGMDPDEYMPSVFLDAVRLTLRTGGFLAVDKSREEGGGDALIGYRGRLFRLADDLQAGRILDPVAAIGSGDQLALGALWATRPNPDPRRRLLTALGAAEQFNGAVCRPFTVVHGGRA